MLLPSFLFPESFEGSVLNNKYEGMTKGENRMRYIPHGAVLMTNQQTRFEKLEVYNVVASDS